MDEPEQEPERDQDVVEPVEQPGESIDGGQARKFPCGKCGADLEFSIGVQKLKCPFCGDEQSIELTDDSEVKEQDFNAFLKRLSEQRTETRPSSFESHREISCDSCGGTAEFTGSLTSSECPFCGSPLQLDDVHQSPDRIPVDGVLPFQVKRKKARENLSTWVKSRWFAPTEFLQRGAEGRFNGVYLPYWTFDSMTFVRYSGARGEYYWETVGSGEDERREQRTRWYPTRGKFQRFFDDVLIIALRRMNKKFVEALEPWPLEKVRPFDQQLLAGYLARTYETELKSGFQEARRRIKSELKSDVRKRIGGDTQRVDRVDTRFDAVTFKHLLLPVWLLAYRYNKKTYQVYVNAATGEVQGERPYSWIKISLAVCAVAIIVGAIGYFRS